MRDEETVKEGKTASEFHKLINKWMQKNLEVLDLATMMEIFKPIVPEFLEEIKESRDQGQAYMAEELKKNVPKIIEEYNLIEKQNRLEKLIKEAEPRERVKVRVVPTPTQVGTGVVHEAKKAEAIRLQKMLDDITEENYVLMHKIKSETKQVKEKGKNLDAKINHFNKNVAITRTLPAEDLIEVMKELDVNK